MSEVHRVQDADELSDSTEVSTTLHTEKIERFTVLNSGTYWKALEDIEDKGITEGMVLLLESVRFVEGVPHTIILRPHPKHVRYMARVRDDSDSDWYNKTIREHRFLTDDFLVKFEFEPDYKRIRTAEIKEIQDDIDRMQNKMIRVQSNPQEFQAIVDKRIRKKRKRERKENPEEVHLPSTIHAPADIIQHVQKASIKDVVKAGVTEDRILAMRHAAEGVHEQAVVRSEWLKERTEKIGDRIKDMVPYYEEQAKAALAGTEDVREYVKKLERGIETLDLYTGKNVNIKTINEGTSADPDVPLTCVQKKLYADEEIAVWRPVDSSWDIRDMDSFDKALVEEESFKSQIFPTERCVVIVAATRRDIDYGDVYVNHYRNKENKQVFLLVRDGENMYRVSSPIESHSGAVRLFPGRDELEQHFHGVDGTQITLQDVAFTDRLRDHESETVHYKRFLILFAGLDHRLSLFGPFHDKPDSFDFVTVEFQNKHMRFLRDDDGEGMLPTEVKMPFRDYIKDLNSEIRPGSRVMFVWRDVLDHECAPACFTYSSNQNEYWRKYDAVKDHEVLEVFKQGKDLAVRVMVTGQTNNWEDRTFGAYVNLSKVEPWGSDRLGCLCVDRLDPDEIEWYIQSRKTREYHLEYIEIFRHAAQHAREEREEFKPVTDKLVDAITEFTEIKDQKKAEKVALSALVSWRGATKFYSADECLEPKHWKNLLNQAWMMAGKDSTLVDSAREWAKENGLKPLRLSVSGKAVVTLHAEPTADERDDRTEKWPWVHRVSFYQTKSGLRESSRKWELMAKRPIDLTVLHDFPGVEDWTGLKSAFKSPAHKDKVFARVSELPDRIDRMNKIPDIEFNEWAAVRDDVSRKYVETVSCVLPFGVYVDRVGQLYYVCAHTSKPAAMFYSAANQHGKQRIIDSYMRVYAHKRAARDRLMEGVKSERWSIGSVGEDKIKSSNYIKNSWWSRESREHEGEPMKDVLQRHIDETDKYYPHDEPIADRLWIPEGNMEALDTLADPADAGQ